ncbi:hypothetical protein C9374_005200 [Naegleria lovaniensis]|uniref:Protein kinase domain-containing protein n=1 Tax=Naegleria lovaniensis TaxID=51637 RepID=A0AA88GR91_NAELO|nr:uncharacterized protein C9374_005200 [Naegleria lovaniensis]KAG2382620.1 hypothetical protein C9374_005200 [Naegleria lovaniensis]
MSLFRIDRILSGMGLCSRSEAISFIRKNEIIDPIKKQRILSLKHKILEQDISKLLVNGAPFQFPTLNLTIALNKPIGYLCSTVREDSNHKLIYDLLPQEFSHRHPTLGYVGRLDLDSSGLLLLTQDGDFHHRVLRNDIEKRYEVSFIPEITSEQELEEMKRTFFSGELQLRSEEKALRPITNFEFINPSTISISIVEGKYHQVRRMFAACSKRVVALKRTHIGEISLEDLGIESPGDCSNRTIIMKPPTTEAMTAPSVLNNLLETIFETNSFALSYNFSTFVTAGMKYATIRFVMYDSKTAETKFGISSNLLTVKTKVVDFSVIPELSYSPLKITGSNMVQLTLETSDTLATTTIQKLECRKWNTNIFSVTDSTCKVGTLTSDITALTMSSTGVLSVVDVVNGWRPLARFLPLGGDKVDEFGNQSGQYSTRKLVYSSSRIILDVAPSRNTSKCFNPDTSKQQEPSVILQMDERSLISQEAHVLHRLFDSGHAEFMYRSKQNVNIYNVTQELYMAPGNVRTSSPQAFKILSLSSLNDQIMCCRDGFLTQLTQDHIVVTHFNTGMKRIMDCSITSERNITVINILGIQSMEGGLTSATVMRIEWEDLASRSVEIFALEKQKDQQYIDSFFGRILTTTTDQIMIAGSALDHYFKIFRISKSDIAIMSESVINLDALSTQYHLPQLFNQLALPCELFEDSQKATIFTVALSSARTSLSLISMEASTSQESVFILKENLLLVDLISDVNKSTIDNIFLFRGENLPLVVTYSTERVYHSAIYRNEGKLALYSSDIPLISSKGGKLHNMMMINYCDDLTRTLFVEIREKRILTFTSTLKNSTSSLNDYKIGFASDWMPASVEGKRIQLFDDYLFDGNATTFNTNSTSVAEIRYSINNPEVGTKATAIHLIRFEFDPQKYFIHVLETLLMISYNPTPEISKDLVSFFPYSNDTLLVAVNSRNGSHIYSELIEFQTQDWTITRRKQLENTIFTDSLYIYNDYLYLANATSSVAILSLEDFSSFFLPLDNTATTAGQIEKTVKISSIIHKNMSQLIETDPKPVFPLQPYIFYATSKGKIYQMELNGKYTYIDYENTISVKNTSLIPMSGIFFNLHLYVTYYPGQILDVEFRETFKNGKYALVPISQKFYDLPFIQSTQDVYSTKWTAEIDCYAEYTYFTGDDEAIYKLEMRSVPFALYDIEPVNIYQIADMKTADTSGTLLLIDLKGHIIIRDISLYPDIRFYLVIAVISLLSVTLFVISIVCIIPVIMRYKRRRLISEKRKTFRELIVKSSVGELTIQKRLYLVSSHNIFIKKKFRPTNLITNMPHSLGPHGIMFDATLSNTPIMMKKMTTPFNVYREDLIEEAKQLAVLRHRNIQSYLGISIDDTNIKYIVYEKLPDYICSLREYVEAGIINASPNVQQAKKDSLEKYLISFQEKLQLVRDAMNGLSYLHKKGFQIHGNLKPSNILVHYVEPKESRTIPEEENEKSKLASSINNFVAGRNVARVTDYGFLRYCKDVVFSETDLMFKSPEVLQQKESTPLNLDFKSDIYELSMVMFSLFFLKMPYEVVNTSQIISGELRPQFPFDLQRDDSIWNWFNTHYENDDYLGAISFNILHHDPNKTKSSLIKNMKKICSTLESMWSSNPNERPTARQLLDNLKDVLP